MPFELYDYVDAAGVNVIAEWTKGLQKKERGKLVSKLDLLREHGSELFPQMLTGTDTAGIMKLRVHGNVQLRPLLCDGPIEVGKEFTLLLGAKEVGSKLVPTDADRIADINKTAVKAAPEKRRRKHEHVR